MPHYAWGIHHPLHPNYEGVGKDVLARFMHVLDLPADEIIARELPELRKRSYDLVRNSIFSGINGTMVTNIVGAGLRFQCELPFKALGLKEEDASALEEKIEQLFYLHAETENIDASRTKNFYELQKVMCHMWFDAGDGIAQLCNLTDRPMAVSSLAVNLIDAARVSNPNYRVDTPEFSGGIEKGSYGEPLRYHVLTNDNYYTSKWVPVDVFSNTGVRNITHVYSETRAGQSRGVPHITPVLKTFSHINKYSEAELKAATIASFFAIMIKQVSLDGSQLTPGGVDIAQTLGISKPKDVAADIKMAPGQMVNLPQGYGFETIKSDRPNSGYGTFIESKLREIAIALEIPYEILVKTFGQSYSASRGAMLEFWKLVKVYRNTFSFRFCQHVFERFLLEMVATNRLRIPGYLNDAYTRRLINSSAVWVGPPKGMIDEQKEAQAAKIRMEARLSTLKEEIINLTGGDLNSKYTQMKAERRMIRELDATEAA